MRSTTAVTFTCLLVAAFLLALPAGARESAAASSPGLSGDASDSALSVQASAVMGNVELLGQTGGASNAVAVQGHYAYLGVGPRLVVLDVSDPAHPAFIGQTDPLPGVVSDVAISGTTAYVAALESGLRVVDVSAASAPREVGAYDTPGQATGVAVLGNIAYVADRASGLRLVDVSNALHPTGLGAYNSSGSSYDVAVRGHLVYLADGSGGLRIVDVSNVLSPTEVGVCQTYAARGIAVSGTLGYVANWGGGLRIIDISNSHAPTDTGALATLVPARHVAVSGAYAYVATG